MNTSNPELNALLDHLLQAGDRVTLAHYLNQLLTPSELDEIVKRLQIMNLLEQGVPQRKIAEQLGVGIATVSSGARALKEP